MAWIETLLTSLPIAFSIVAGAYTLTRSRKVNREEAERRQEDELRKDEVLKWSFKGIEALQALDCLSSGSVPGIDASKKIYMRQELVLQTSVLIGQGRLFFKNVLTENSDSKGFRPKILDPLILAHRIAAHWPDDDDARSILTKRCVSGFIQFAGDEVGRKQAASVLAASAGDEMNLTFWMCEACQNGAKSLFE